MTALVDPPTGSDVARVLGRERDDDFVTGLANVAADLACQAASSYTRGVGFEDESSVPESLYHVILLRAVRFATNYEQLQLQQHDGVRIAYGMAGQGFTVQEIKALEAFRRTAA